MCLACATAPRSAAPRDQASCRDKDPDTSAPGKDGSKPFDVATRAGFSAYEAVLRDFMSHNAPGTEANFCIVGFAHDQDWQQAWVLWAQGDRILDWGGEPKMVAPRETNLKTDVVASKEQIGGSTYLVTQEWVNRLREACACFGRTVFIKAAGDRTNAPNRV
jgi:hypothetical protein